MHSTDNDWNMSDTVIGAKVNKRRFYGKMDTKQMIVSMDM